MQDIDFDEIDRAVNSVSDSLTAEKTVETPQVPETPSAEPVVAVPAPTPVAPRPTSGRFMDVVHPSSDMRPSVPQRPSAPSAPSLHREEAVAHDEVSKRPEPAATASAAFHWPDPIESATPATEPTPEPVVEMPVPEPPVITEELSEEPAGSLESPFLSGTKVEKRPLGAFSDTDLPLIEDPIPGTYVFGDTPQVKPEEPAHEEHEETPQELHPDVLSLDGHSKDSKEDSVAESAPAPEVVDEAEPIASVVAETPVTPEAPAGPTSISQQYVEQPRTASEPSGSIFDTEAYHKALEHPPKKRSKALIVVWIAVLILIGGGIGAAIYFVVLPMLG